MNYSKQNLQKKSFQGQDLSGADFSGSDLRGADFTGATLTGADFSNSVTGLTNGAKILLFIFTLLISMFSGYIAMLIGSTTQTLLKNPDFNYNLAGYGLIAAFALLIIIAIRKGGVYSLKLLIPFLILVLLASAYMRISGMGTGKGALLAALALSLLVVMVLAGTIARATAGTIASNIIFIIVALGGGMFGKSLGGGLGTVALAVACAVISKRALKNTKGFELIYNIAVKTSSYFGTSFKETDLRNADFRNSEICSTDFSGANLDGINWENSKIKYSQR